MLDAFFQASPCLPAKQSQRRTFIEQVHSFNVSLPLLRLTEDLLCIQVVVISYAFMIYIVSSFNIPDH